MASKSRNHPPSCTLQPPLQMRESSAKSAHSALLSLSSAVCISTTTGRSRLLRSHFARSILVMEKTQCGSKGIAHRASAASCSGKHKRKGGSGGGGKPIKVVYISNPVRVSTSAAGFRALVQDLTGRNADPSKYTGSGAVDVGESSAGSPAGPQMGPAPSPGSTAESSEGAAACSHNVPATATPAGYEYDDEEDSFAPHLIDNRYSVFSPPTFLSGSHNEW